MASSTKESVPTDDVATREETDTEISGKLDGVESELGLTKLSDEISSSLLDASLSEYQ